MLYVWLCQFFDVENEKYQNCDDSLMYINTYSCVRASVCFVQIVAQNMTKVVYVWPLYVYIAMYNMYIT